MPSVENAQGLYVVAQTPFDENGALDLNSIDTLVDFYSKHGADGLTVLGVAGEATKLSSDEALQVATRYIRRAANKPVVVGVSNANIALLRELTLRVMDVGAAGVMIAPPPGLKTEDDVQGYFAAAFAQINGVPTVLQDFPTSSQVWMSVNCILRLVEDFPQIKIIKEEDLPSLGKIAKLRASAGRRISILTGNNGVYLPQELARGVDGPMSGFSYPEMLSGVYRHYRAGKCEAALDMFDAYLPLLNFENQSQWGVAVRKEVMRRRGAIRSATMRAPGPRLTAADYQDIDVLMRRVEKAAAGLALR